MVPPPSGSTLDLDECSEINDTNSVRSIDNLLGMDEQIVVTPLVVETSEQIERPVIGQQSDLPSGEEQRRVGLDAAFAGFADGCMKNAQQSFKPGNV